MLDGGAAAVQHAFSLRNESAPAEMECTPWKVRCDARTILVQLPACHSILRRMFFFCISPRVQHVRLPHLEISLRPRQDEPLEDEVMT